MGHFCVLAIDQSANYITLKNCIEVIGGKTSWQQENCQYFFKNNASVSLAPRPKTVFKYDLSSIDARAWKGYYPYRVIFEQM